MVKVSYDRKYDAVIIEFQGKIDAAQADQSFFDVEKVLPKKGRGFKVLTDFTGAERMEIEVKGAVKKNDGPPQCARCHGNPTGNSRSFRGHRI